MKLKRKLISPKKKTFRSYNIIDYFAGDQRSEANEQTHTKKKCLLKSVIWSSLHRLMSLVFNQVQAGSNCCLILLSLFSLCLTLSLSLFFVAFASLFVLRVRLSMASVSLWHSFHRRLNNCITPRKILCLC